MGFLDLKTLVWGKSYGWEFTNGIQEWNKAHKKSARNDKESEIVTRF